MSELVSADPCMPRVGFDVESEDLITFKCETFDGCISPFYVNDIHVGSHIVMADSGEEFADVIVRHQLDPDDGWPYTQEAIDVLGALVWSAVRAKRMNAKEFAATFAELGTETVLEGS